MQMPRPHPKSQNTPNGQNFRVGCRNVHVYRARRHFSCTHSLWTVAHKSSSIEAWVRSSLPASLLILCAHSHLRLLFYFLPLHGNILHLPKSYTFQKVYLKAPPSPILIYSDLSRGEFFSDLTHQDYLVLKTPVISPVLVLQNWWNMEWNVNT